MKQRIVIGGALAVLSLAVAGGLLWRWFVEERAASMPKSPVRRVPAAWRDVRESPGHTAHVAQQGLACEKCHGTNQGFEVPSLQVCASCHAEQATMRHGINEPHVDDLLGTADCTSCHDFRSAETRDAWNCIRCHELQQGELHAIEVHAREACSTCHRPHDPVAIQPAACVACHASSDNTHAKLPGGEAENCLTCHRAHAPAAIANDRCTDCHDKPLAFFANGHTRCQDCHTPHGFSQPEAKPCRSCHSDQHVLAETRVPAHRACTSCHDPHAASTAPSAACERCHTDVSPAHPVPGQQRATLTSTVPTGAAGSANRCTGCHEPHPKPGSGPIARACTQCHTQAPRDTAVHGAGATCTSCHAVHAFAPSTALTKCTNCHAQQLTAVAKNAGHAQCSGCHGGDIHAAEHPPVACATCHQDVHPRKEHTDCVTCHEPHSGAPRAVAESCGSCHVPQLNSVHTEHRDCLTCHTPHEGGRPEPARCETCHRAKADQNHGALPGGCTQCHSIHGKEGAPATPACTSCHDVKSLPGAHAIEAHQNCTTCHTNAHDTGPWSERATCLSCHNDRKQHVPEAALCQGCHVFRR
jgi:hypothetical protein